MTNKDRFYLWFIWLLPRSLVYWCTIRLWTYASMKYSNTEMTAITIEQALIAWEVGMKK